MATHKTGAGRASWQMVSDTKYFEIKYKQAHQAIIFVVWRAKRNPSISVAPCDDGV
jgi:hypothetical protein